MNISAFVGTSIVTIVVSIVLYMKWKLTYWRRKDLDYIEPELLFGNIREVITQALSFGDMSTKIYNHFKSKGLKHGGFYGLLRPTYMPLDPQLVGNIVQKDFSYFINHGLLYVNEKTDPLTGHLFNLENEKWRQMRMKLTPTFTSGKMKMMFQTLLACTTGLVEVLEHQSKQQDAVDIKDVIAKYTTDVVGSCGFGIESNSLKQPDSVFRKYGRRIFEMSTYERLRNLLFFLLPKEVLDILKMKQFPQDVEDFFINIVRETMEYRESKNVYRKDFIQLLLEIKNKGFVSEDKTDKEIDATTMTDNPLTINEMAAQCFVFFIAGFETSASAITFALLELALNQDIQEKLRTEIATITEKHDGEITYDAVMEMAYLDKIVHETLRKHPPIPTAARKCNKAYHVPGTPLILEPGTLVEIPVQAIHRDADYYPNPEKFDPERFSPENKAKRPQFTFLTFGEGPRYCIGARFGLLQTKMGILKIISNFKVTLNKKTKMPIKHATERFITVVDGGVWLDLERIPEKTK